MFTRRFLLLGTGVLALAAVLFATTGQVSARVSPAERLGKVEGFVFRTDGMPAAGAIIKFYSSSGRWLGDVTANRSGTFVYAAPEGRYSLTVGYKGPEMKTEVKIDAGKTTRVKLVLPVHR